MSHLPRVVELDDGTMYALKVIEIGDWNMDATASVTIAHGLTLANIRIVQVIVRDDADTGRYELCGKDGTSIAGDITEINGTNVVLSRTLSKFFDSADFDSTTYNRGWIHVWYVV